MLSLAIKHFCDTTHRLIFQRVLSLCPSPLRHSTPITLDRIEPNEKIATKIHTPSNTAFPEAAYLMHETCRRRLNKTVTHTRHHVNVCIINTCIYILIVWVLCIVLLLYIIKVLMFTYLGGHGWLLHSTDKSLPFGLSPGHRSASTSTPVSRF